MRLGVRAAVPCPGDGGVAWRDVARCGAAWRGRGAAASVSGPARAAV